MPSMQRLPSSTVALGLRVTRILICSGPKVGKQVLSQGGVDQIAQGFAGVGRLALGMAKDLIVQHEGYSLTNIRTYADSVVKRPGFLREYRRTSSASG